MRDKPVIDSANMPRKAPLLITLVLIIGLRAFSAPQWAIGATVAVIIFLWIMYVRDIILFKEKDVNLFTKNKSK